MFQISYRIQDENFLTQAPRIVDVDATEEQIESIRRDGFLVREGLIQGDHLAALREAVDEVEAEALKTEQPGEGSFGGLFVRDLLDRHPTFLAMLNYSPALSVSRALLGPQVQVHAMVMRVSYPERPGQGVEWHIHQRVVPIPIPPFFSRPEVIDHLIYLDDVDLNTGPLVVLPGSHLISEDLPGSDHSDKPGQVVLEVPAGTVVTAPSSLWHKAMPTKPGGHKRRLIILGHSPTWMKPVDSFGGPPTAELRRSGDLETLELLGVRGFF